jgi:hypothetical protein
MVAHLYLYANACISYNAFRSKLLCICSLSCDFLRALLNEDVLDAHRKTKVESPVLECEIFTLPAPFNSHTVCIDMLLHASVTLKARFWNILPVDMGALLDSLAD